MILLYKIYEITNRAGYNKRAGMKDLINTINEQAENVRAGLQKFLKFVSEHARLLESSEYTHTYIHLVLATKPCVSLAVLCYIRCKYSATTDCYKMKS